MGIQALWAHGTPAHWGFLRPQQGQAAHSETGGDRTLSVWRGSGWGRGGVMDSAVLRVNQDQVSRAVWRKRRQPC